MQQQESNYKRFLHQDPNPFSQHSSGTLGTLGTCLHNLSPSRVDARTSSSHLNDYNRIRKVEGATLLSPTATTTNHTLKLKGKVEISKHENCRMDLPGPTTSVGTRTDYSVGPWDYPTCAARYLKA
jgi:hypothetical protein